MRSKSWKILESKQLFESKIFKLRVEKCELPDKRVMPRYFVMDFPDWVQVVPVTSEGQIVMLKQYRHAAKDTFLEIPGGSTEPDSDETPEEAGLRELREETGYSGTEVISLGEHYPNPATQSNSLHTFLVKNCKMTHQPSLDEFEDLEVVLMDIDKVYQALEAGQIKHSLMIASLALARPHLYKASR